MVELGQPANWDLSGLGYSGLDSGSPRHYLNRLLKEFDNLLKGLPFFFKKGLLKKILFGNKGFICTSNSILKHLQFYTEIPLIFSCFFTCFFAFFLVRITSKIEIHKSKTMSDILV